MKGASQPRIETGLGQFHKSRIATPAGMNGTMLEATENPARFTPEKTADSGYRGTLLG
jgi:hypothetical protein